MVFSNSVWLVRPVCQQVFISATSLLLENGEINRNAESLESTAGRKYIKPAVTVEDSFHHFRVKMWLHASVACTQIWLVSRFRLDQVTLNIPELCCCTLEDFPWCTEHRSPCFYSTAAFVFCSLCFWCFVTLFLFELFCVSLCCFCLFRLVLSPCVCLWSFMAVFQSNLLNLVVIWCF